MAIVVFVIFRTPLVSGIVVLCAIWYIPIILHTDGHSGLRYIQDASGIRYCGPMRIWIYR